jgi:hypothetical protein
VDRDGEITNEWLARGIGQAMADYVPREIACDAGGAEAVLKR